MRSSHPTLTILKVSGQDPPPGGRRLPSGIAHHGYVRSRDLPRLLPLWPEESADGGLESQGRLVARLRIMLRRERQRGIAGDWCYDLARHRQLLVAWRAEAAAWQQAMMAARRDDKASSP